MAPPTSAERVAFTTSRHFEYFTVKELQSQIGFPPQCWKVALLKELIDNALDACGRDSVCPVIRVTAAADHFVVEDNGTGIPADVVVRTLDYSTRTSINSKYVSPTRGQLGNALKCVIAAPSVLFPGRDAGVTIESQGVRHRIVVRRDALVERPKVERATEACDVKNGTRVRVDWPQVAGFLPDGEGDDFYNAAHTSADLANEVELANAFATFNPDAEFWLDGRLIRRPPGSPDRWCAHQATSPHWYDEGQLRDLIAAYVIRERQEGLRPMSLREFVSGFNGLSGSTKPRLVLESASVGRPNLADLVDGEDLSEEKVASLLREMKRVARPVKPERLGLIGRDNLLTVMESLYGAVEGYDGYRVVRGEADGRPFVVEAAMKMRPTERGLRVVLGLNWTPCLSPHAFEQFNWVLHEATLDPSDPFVLAVHVATPYAAFSDKGKTRASLPPAVREAIRGAVLKVAEPHSKMKRRKTREQKKLKDAEYSRLRRVRSQLLTIKDATFRVLADAHHHVTGGEAGAPAHARQLMYAARKRVLELTGGRCWEKSSTFTQSYLPAFMRANPQLTQSWNVVYDARGRLIEPHTGNVVELGTLQVRQYAGGWRQADYGGSRPTAQQQEVPTLGEFVRCRRRDSGPFNLYQFVLLVEKQGFEDLLRHTGVAARFDVSLATTKGHSTTSARELIDELSGLGVTTLVLHDFDYDGLKILHGLKSNNDRYRFRNEPLVVDLGFRLGDAGPPLNLEGEPVTYPQKRDPSDYLVEIGATEEEVGFLVAGRSNGSWGPYVGRRIELNEMTNAQFLDFIQRKLTAAGAKKVVPGEETLANAFVDSARQAMIAHHVEQAKREAEAQAWQLFGDRVIKPPKNLGAKVAKVIKGKPTPWNDALAELVRKFLGKAR